MPILNPYLNANTAFDDIDFLIANFMDTTSYNIVSGGINSIRRCIIAL